MHTEDLSAHLKGLVGNCKDRLMQKLSQTAQKTHEQTIKDMVYDRLGRLTETFAKDLADAYSSEIQTFNSNIRPVLLGGFGLSG